MNRARLALVLALGATMGFTHLPAHAYSGGSCSNSQVVTFSTAAGSQLPQCSFTLSCPAATVCAWTMRIQVNGIGYVTGRLYVYNSTYEVTCDGLTTCQSSQSGFAIPAGQSRTIGCAAPPFVLGFVVYAGVPAVNVSASCTATVG